MSTSESPRKPTRLPVVYGGLDAGPRPETRHQVHDALTRGVDPVLVVSHVEQGLSDLWTAFGTTPEATREYPACRKGCSHCCHQRVAVTAPEVFAITRYLQQSQTSPALLQRLEQAATLHATLSTAEHFQSQSRCPFLETDGQCGVYSVRPLACRRAHSLDAAVCEALAEDPTLEVRVPYSATLGWNTSALVLGYYEGSLHAGSPPHQFELIIAVWLTLSETDVEQRWLSGQPVLDAALSHDADELAVLLKEMEQQPV